MKGRPDRRTTPLALLVCAVVFVYASPYFPHLNNPNENVRVQMTAALVEQHTYAIDAMRARWGFTNDAACVEVAADGMRSPCGAGLPPRGATRRLYSVKAPLGSLLAVPGYALYRAFVGSRPLAFEEAVRVCRISGSILPALGLLYVMRRFFERDLAKNPFARDAAFFAFALGSVALGYVVLFVSHTTSALFAFAAFARLVEASRRRSIGALDAALTGFFASGTTALEYPCLFVSVVLCAQALFSIRSFGKLVMFGLGALVPVALVMHFQSSAFGSPFSPGHLFVENPGFRVFHQRGFFGADTFHPEAAAGLLVHPRLGLFATTPFFVLAPLGYLHLRGDASRRTAARFALALCLSLYAPVVFLSNWDGGWVIGPRYLLAIFPFVAWLSAHGTCALLGIAPSLAGLALGLFVASLAASGIPSTYYPHLPPEVMAPLGEVFVPLIRDGYAPDNLGLLAGLPMRTSMLPLVAVALGVVLFVIRGLPGGVRPRALLVAIPVAVAALTPQFPLGEPSPGGAAALRFVESHWSPPRDAVGP